MPHIQVGDVNYHVNIRGSGDPIILLHGFTGCGENWQFIAEALAHDYQVITLDLLGHGKSDSPPDPHRYGMEVAAQDLITLVEMTIGQPVNLVGYSMGGRLALYLALNYPQHIKKLILESASPGLSASEERLARIQSDELFANRIQQNGIAAFVDEWEKLPLFASQSDEICQQLRIQRLQNNPTGLANSLRGMGTGVQPALWEKLPQLKPPTLLITGELDKKFIEIARQMHNQLPQSQHEIITQAGHTVHLEQPDAYISLLRSFT